MNLLYLSPAQLGGYMRVDCPHCYKKAIITSSNALSETIKDLYCQCTNTAECGASFVFSLSFKHNLNPPIQTTRQLAMHLLKSLPLQERQAMQNELFN